MVKGRAKMKAKIAKAKRKRPPVNPNRVWRWDVILPKIDKRMAVKGAEIGVLKGALARRILEARPLCTHIMVDPWQRPEEGSRYAEAPGVTQHKSQEQFEQCYESVKGLKGKWGERAVIMRMRSLEAAPLIEDESLDYVFIDAEHTYEGVSEDIRAWLPKVKKGGWIGGHDYENEPKFTGVKRAVDEAFPGGVEKREDHTWFVVKG